MRRDKAVLDDKGVLRRGPRGARVWVEIYPLKPAQAQASRATFPTHWGRKGSRLWCITRLVEIDAAAAVPTAPYGLAGGVVELGRSPDGLARMLGRSPQSDPSVGGGLSQQRAPSPIFWIRIASR